MNKHIFFFNLVNNNTANATVTALVSELAKRKRHFKELARSRVKCENEIERARRKIDIIDRDTVAEHEKIVELAVSITRMNPALAEELFG